MPTLRPHARRRMDGPHRPDPAAPEPETNPVLLATRRSRRESERERPPRIARISSNRPRSTRGPSGSEPRHPSTLRSRLLGLSAMTAVALLAVTASLPAMAVSVDASTSVPVVTSSPPRAAQVFGEVSGSAAAAVIARDGYAVIDAPKIAPKKATSAGLGARALGGRDTGQLLGQAWALPVDGVITDPFGPRPDRPVAGVEPFHNGTDIAAACGTPVLAATGGTVVYSDYNGSYGNWILIDHGNGVTTAYAHNSTLLVSVGQTVAVGETIARVGSTGSSTGCHLDFRTYVDETPIDPEPFMSARGITLG